MSAQVNEIPDPWSIPLDQINVAQPVLFQNDAHWDYFARLRAEDPVHYCADSPFGPYWSVTKFKDIFEVDTSHQIFSSASGITMGGSPGQGGQQRVQRSGHPKCTLLKGDCS